MLPPKKNVSRAEQMYSFLPKFSDGVLINGIKKPLLKKSSKIYREQANTSTLHPSSPSQVSKQMQRRSSKASKPPRRLSWLAEPAPCPCTPSRRSSISSRKKSISRGEANLKNDQSLYEAFVREFRGGSSSSAISFGSEDTFDSSVSDIRSMSSRFPMSAKTGKFILRKRTNQRDCVIESSGGDIVGSVDVSKEGTTRLLKDASGKTCAVILQTHDDSRVDGGNVFKVYNNKPATPGQQKSKKSNTNGLYLWAEIKNTGSMGGKFVLKMYSSDTSSCSTNQHIAKRFGAIFSKSKLKGYTFLDSEKKECVKMVSLEKRTKGVLIAPNRDTCLMLAYCVVVDEMVEQRLR